MALISSINLKIAVPEKVATPANSTQISANPSLKNVSFLPVIRNLVIDANVLIPMIGRNAPVEKIWLMQIQTI